MDKEIAREIWEGKLPLCFRLHPDEVVGNYHPDPMYMLVSRVSYFPLVLDRVVKYFQKFIEVSKETMNDLWLDYQGQPIKSHHPIGLSWDLFGSQCELPWHLMLHFRNFPENDILRCNTKTAAETHFISTIKEADTLKHKRSVMRSMVKKDQNQLWLNLQNDKFDKFWTVNKRLMEKTDDELFRYIPFKMYFQDYTYVQKTIAPCTISKPRYILSRQSDHPPLIDINPVATLYDYSYENSKKKSFKCSHNQSLVEETEESKNHRSSTLMDLIEICFSDRLDDLFSRSIDLEEYSDKQIDVRLFRYKFISHGIEIPFDASLQWLSENFSYPDNFLHLCAVIKD